MSMPSSPVVRRQRLGAELRKLRRDLDMTGEQVISELGWPAQSKLTRIERGQSRQDLADVMNLLDLYGVTGADREKLIIIARDAADTRGWYRAFAGMGARQRSYVELESGAARIREYQQFVIPGLLQTPEYARVRMESGRELYGEDLDQDIDTRAREARQRVLMREMPPQYEAIIEECALRRAVAPPTIMQGQLRRLIEVSELPNVSIRILTLGAAVADFWVPHSAFSIYAFADPDDPTIVTLEALTSDLQLRDEEDVERYETVYQWASEAALSTGASTRLIRTLADQT